MALAVLLGGAVHAELGVGHDLQAPILDGLLALLAQAELIGGGAQAAILFAGRPWLQGARLTVWELMQDGIDVSLIADSAAAWLMAGGHDADASGDSADAALEAVMAGAPSWAIRKGAVWWLRRRERAGRVEVVLVAVRAPDEP